MFETGQTQFYDFTKNSYNSYTMYTLDGNHNYWFQMFAESINVVITFMKLCENAILMYFQAKLLYKFLIVSYTI